MRPARAEGAGRLPCVSDPNAKLPEAEGRIGVRHPDWSIKS